METTPTSPSPNDSRARARRLDSILVFVFAVGVALASLPHRSGYPIADAVEYLKNAGLVESGQELGGGSVRPFFYSALLLPIFRAARVLGSSDGREVFALVTAFMIGLGGLAAVATYRFVEKIGGAAAAIAAALFLSANRVFQFWVPNAMTDVPSSLCIGAAAACAMAPPSRWNALRTGLLLGAAIAFKYQAIQALMLFAGCMVFLWKPPGKRLPWVNLGLLFSGSSAGMALQSLLDLLAGRPFGATLLNYLRDNVLYPIGGRLAPILNRTIGPEAANQFLESLTSTSADVAKYSEVRAADPGMLLSQSRWYYFENIPELLTWFEVALFVIGAAVLARRRPRGWWFPIVFLAASVAILSGKGSKDFRLWVPFLPFVCCMVGVGFASLVARIDRRLPTLAAIVAFCAFAFNLITILGGIPLQTQLARVSWARPLLVYDSRTPIAVKKRDGTTREERKGFRPWQVLPEPRNPADFGGYERAARWLNQNAPAGARVSATWFWQFHYRLRPDLVLVAHRVQIDDFRKLPAPDRADIAAHLRSLDFLVVHLSSVLEPGLFDIVDREFETVQIFENAIYDDSLDTLFVLKKRARPGDENAWVRIIEGREAAEIHRNARPDSIFSLRTDPSPTAKPVIQILSCTFDPAELEQGRVQVRIVWRVPEGSECGNHDVWLQLKVTNAYEHVIGNAGYRLGYGRVSPDRWKPGVIIEQRIPIRPARELFDFARPRTLNEAVSLDAWIQLVCKEPGDPSKPAFHYPVGTGERYSRFQDPVFGRIRIGGSDCVAPRPASLR
ncbi:MAG: hypothetical protein JNJ88_02275 [Planctomycetes bacterium]|nr:hypothetical protein [Planctomycetota bacterium]